jgi:hypothetical protein
MSSKFGCSSKLETSLSSLSQFSRHMSSHQRVFVHHMYLHHMCVCPSVSAHHVCMPFMHVFIMCGPSWMCLSCVYPLCCTNHTVPSSWMCLSCVYPYCCTIHTVPSSWMCLSRVYHHHGCACHVCAHHILCLSSFTIMFHHHHVHIKQVCPHHDMYAHDVSAPHV